MEENTSGFPNNVIERYTKKEVEIICGVFRGRRGMVENVESYGEKTTPYNLRFGIMIDGELRYHWLGEFRLIEKG